MKYIIFLLSTLLFTTYSYAENKACVDGKMSINEWINLDGTYSDYNTPAVISNGNICFIKPLTGENVQSSYEIISFITSQLTKNNQRSIPASQLPSFLSSITDKYNVYLVHPCRMLLKPTSECENSDEVILGFVTKSQNNPLESSFAVISTDQFIE
ncbi:hypothetical protein [Thalassotalea profundi]|uniref:Uncharacterized protein n=1 Tax=Thalassotalea profundi TaxID=2036687 RepID=A0ABQ3IK43_9GAMM|nr:hypothetical protein [Thalassotalea profundi]GHE83723.1 hypothetical protein GCM10011501_10420 [Thalassotalea profundi]